MFINNGVLFFLNVSKGDTIMHAVNHESVQLDTKQFNVLLNELEISTRDATPRPRDAQIIELVKGTGILKDRTMGREPSDVEAALMRRARICLRELKARHHIVFCGSRKAVTASIFDHAWWKYLGQRIQRIFSHLVGDAHFIDLQGLEFPSKFWCNAALCSRHSQLRLEAACKSFFDKQMQKWGHTDSEISRIACVPFETGYYNVAWKISDRRACARSGIHAAKVWVDKRSGLEGVLISTASHPLERYASLDGALARLKELGFSLVWGTHVNDEDEGRSPLPVDRDEDSLPSVDNLLAKCEIVPIDQDRTALPSDEAMIHLVEGINRLYLKAFLPNQPSTASLDLYRLYEGLTTLHTHGIRLYDSTQEKGLWKWAKAADRIIGRLWKLHYVDLHGMHLPSKDHICAAADVQKWDSTSWGQEVSQFRQFREQAAGAQSQIQQDIERLSLQDAPFADAFQQRVQRYAQIDQPGDGSSTVLELNATSLSGAITVVPNSAEKRFELRRPHMPPELYPTFMLLAKRLEQLGYVFPSEGRVFLDKETARQNAIQWQVTEFTHFGGHMSTLRQADVMKALRDSVVSEQITLCHPWKGAHDPLDYRLSVRNGDRYLTYISRSLYPDLSEEFSQGDLLDLPQWSTIRFYDNWPVTDKELQTLVCQDFPQSIVTIT
jgi:hypothetical protein